MSKDTDLRSDADVRVVASTDRRNHPTARITVDDKYEHTFPATSRVSKALELMTPVALEERLQGGHYFFVNGALFDFRDGNYNGFIHGPDNIDALKNTIGIRLPGDTDHRDRGFMNTQSRTTRLSKVWSEKEIQVPGMDEGGVFNSRLTFSWNPFVETIRSSFDIERLICENGMTGLTSLFNAKIPLLNRWEEHLDIADMQIQNKLYAMLSERFRNMADERATLSDVLRLQDHIINRLRDARNRSTQVGGRSDTLRNLNKVVDPSTHLRDCYKDNAFKDRRLAAQLPSHLSVFDAYNIATELSTHTSPVDNSSTHALDKYANELVFDRQDRRAHAARFGGPSQASFSNPDTAFFGEVDEDDSE
jgi:hypothetical protein